MGYLTREPKKIMGRPMKYTDLLGQLDEEDLYTPAAIAITADEIGYVDPDLPREERLLHLQRIRITMGRLSKNRKFPPGGDGMRRLPNQAPMPAWFGWRWRWAAKGIKSN